VSVGRWLCNKCGRRFREPDYSLVDYRLQADEMISDDDPTLPPGQVIKYQCPTCGSGDLVGSANPDPFTPKKVKRK